MSTDKEVKEQLLKQIYELKAKIAEMGGPKGVERQRKLGKLTARERIEKLLDSGSFVEVGALVKHRGTELGMDKREVAADGVVTVTVLLRVGGCTCSLRTSPQWVVRWARCTLRRYA